MPAASVNPRAWLLMGVMRPAQTDLRVAGKYTSACMAADPGTVNHSDLFGLAAKIG